MRVANWDDYRILDTSNGEKLECWGDKILIRPDPQIIWKPEREVKEWKTAHARYNRSNKGGGEWQYYKKLPNEWQINYKNLRFNIRPTGFKHTGLFPEQAVNWDMLERVIKKADREVNVLNLFAYTGGATLACLNAGASVCHVDASKGMVSWARENATASGLADRPVRWIVDDCEKFVTREIKRGRKYDIIIMDPPSYGRGPSGEVWQLEEKVYDLVSLCSNVLSDDPLLFVLNSYTTGLPPSVMEYIINITVGKIYKGKVWSDEIGLPVEASGGVLPCGSTACFEKEF